MTRIDLSPLYRNSIGFDRLANMLDSSMHNEHSSAGYPPYNIEAHDENSYSITLAVAGFSHEELNIQVEKGVLTIRGKKTADKEDRRFLYQGIANRAFERKFNLAEHVEVSGAAMDNGLLTVTLLKQIPEEMKAKTIRINPTGTGVDHQSNQDKAA
jgi:molecular chaperone IbpA